MSSQGRREVPKGSTYNTEQKKRSNLVQVMSDDDYDMGGFSSNKPPKNAARGNQMFDDIDIPDPMIQNIPSRKAGSMPPAKRDTELDFMDSINITGEALAIGKVPPE